MIVAAAAAAAVTVAAVAVVAGEVRGVVVGVVGIAPWTAEEGETFVVAGGAGDASVLFCFFNEKLYK